jgi:hypothetical protein
LGIVKKPSLLDGQDFERQKFLGDA